MPQLCLAVASLALSTSRPVSVVLLANRLSLVLPYLLCYHTLLSSAVVSNTELDSYLAGEYGIDQNNIPDKAVYAKKYEQWQLSHQPFHWFVEFYGIIKNGGFDVIIGNPPYVEYSKVRYIYSIQKNVLRTIDCGNLFAYATERAISLACEKGRVGLIVLLASFGTTRMYPLQQLCRENCDLIIASHYEATSHPSVIFVGVEAQLSIILSRKATLENAKRGHDCVTQLKIRYLKNFNQNIRHFLALQKFRKTVCISALWGTSFGSWLLLKNPFFKSMPYSKGLLLFRRFKYLSLKKLLKHLSTVTYFTGIGQFIAMFIILPN